MQDDTTQIRADAVITCRDLVCGYGEAVILSDINLDIHRGEICALLGGSGSGKSTLLKTIVGLLPPIEGDVTVLGHDLYALKPDERRQVLQRTGMLFQYGALFGSKSILDNVALPLREHTDLHEKVIYEMVTQRLGLVGLKGLEHRLPSDVSGGQRKRVALARSTILDPDIVFCDEPSAGLDPIVAAGLDQTLRRFQELFGMTMVVVTHELASIKLLCDRVIMLSGGKILAKGTVPELEASTEREVYNFFHRVAPDYAAEGTSVIDTLS